MGKTSIAWTDLTWNPVFGCSHVSDGCKNCYAERLALRYGWSKKPWTAENAKENVMLHPERLNQPLRWRKPRKVFVNSMSDLFHDDVPENFIVSVFAMMERTPQHTYQILTKRAERMAHFFDGTSMIAVLPNVWLGVSVENQRTSDERIPLLLQTPAAVRFVSCEPLLERVLLRETWLDGQCDHPCESYLSGDTLNCGCVNRCPPNSRLHWIIVGGESGPNHRAMELDWARSIRDQCIAAGVPFFFKQSAGRRPETNPTLDGMVWHQFPEVK